MSELKELGASRDHALTSGSALEGHTPGPWFTDPIDPSEVFGADGFSVAECGGVHIVLNPDGTKHPSEPGQSVERSWPEECANARLIAAAPDYDAAARELVELMSLHESSIKCWDVLLAPFNALRAAISKAEGAS